MGDGRDSGWDQGNLQEATWSLMDDTALLRRWGVQLDEEGTGVTITGGGKESLLPDSLGLRVLGRVAADKTGLPVSWGSRTGLGVSRGLGVR